MNKRILAIVIALAVVVIGAVAAISIGTAQSPDNSADSSSLSGSSDSASTGSVENDGGGAYVDYSPAAIADAEGRIFLFFHAPWCPQCVSMEGDIEAEGVPSGVTIVKVDYDSNQDLRAQYGVTQQTSFVEVDSSGEKLQDNYVAYADPTLQTALDALL
ncbi:thioredoxin family protein [Rhodoglobus aureus]